jgi:hypothetical protein
MRLFTYVVARDFGFAPNPFYGYCTLATCKPQIRSSALNGDWVVGTGAKTKYNLAGYLIYAMKVDEVMDFDSFWNDDRFLCKRPVVNGSLKQLYGDNIYHRHNDQWIQLNSHHSLANGQPNTNNIKYDTRVNRVLISRKFVYYGSAAIQIPDDFHSNHPTERDLCCNGRGYRIRYQDIASEFEAWFNNLGELGVQGVPLNFKSNKRLVEINHENV